jgi:hypothetical protein
MAWLEEGLRAALHRDGCHLLEDLLQEAAASVPGCQAQADEKRYAARPKPVQCLMGRLTLRRDYFYSAVRHTGRFALDETLGLIEGYSPALAKVMCRAGASAAYEAASAELQAYGGIVVEGRQIQRLIQLLGPHLPETLNASPASAAAVPTMYVAADGTGVPMVAAELQGRRGKQPDGSAKTREVKLGCVFTQHHSDAQGRPCRDPHSTTYVASFRPAADFGSELRQEALRRGLGKAGRVAFLGDGAAWVWELARVNFPFATPILDFYHGAQHVRALTDALYGPGTAAAQRQFSRWRKALLRDRVGRVIAGAQRALARRAPQRQLAAQEIAYLQKNESRMRYATFRRQELFIGSGVVEAGCRTVVGQRVKQSGMFWSETGAQHVLNFRCALLGGRFDEYWEKRQPPIRAFAE